MGWKRLVSGEESGGWGVLEGSAKPPGYDGGLYSYTHRAKPTLKTIKVGNLCIIVIGKITRIGSTALLMMMRTEQNSYLFFIFCFQWTFLRLSECVFHIRMSEGMHVSMHARVHVHVFMFSIGPVAKCSLHTESAPMPTGLVSHRTTPDSLHYWVLL